MKARILNVYIILIAIGALFLVLFLLSQPTAKGLYVQTDSKTIPVTVADTPSLRQLGLSGTVSLDRGIGKLFVFDQADKHGFWMKDMAYPIDIVWIDQSFKVIYVVSAWPESYPEVFYPLTEAKYVLEVNAGEALVDGLDVGKKIKFYKQ